MNDTQAVAGEAGEATQEPTTKVKNPEDPKYRGVPDVEANKDVALRFIEGVFIDQDANAVDELASDDFTAHTFGDLPPGREPLKQAMRRAGEGVSDATFQIHDVIAEKDRVAVRLTTRARHTGTFMGVEPSGNEYSIDEIHIFRVEDGKVLEHWHEFDKSALMQQLQRQGGPAGEPRDGTRPPGEPQQGEPQQGRPQQGQPKQGQPPQGRPQQRQQTARPGINARS